MRNTSEARVSVLPAIRHHGVATRMHFDKGRKIVNFIGVQNHPTIGCTRMCSDVSCGVGRRLRMGDAYRQQHRAQNKLPHWLSPPVQTFTVVKRCVIALTRVLTWPKYSSRTSRVCTTIRRSKYLFSHRCKLSETKDTVDDSRHCLRKQTL